MNQIERQARIAKSNHRIWRNVLRSWVIVGAVAFLVGVAAGVVIAGRTQAAGDVLLVKAQAAEPIWTPAPEEGEKVRGNPTGNGAAFAGVSKIRTRRVGGIQRGFHAGARGDGAGVAL